MNYLPVKRTFGSDSPGQGSLAMADQVGVSSRQDEPDFCRFETLGPGR